MAETVPDRSDYMALYLARGAGALTKAIRDRFYPSAVDRELRRMKKSGQWLVEWDKNGEGQVIARVPSDRERSP
jgi:hypothetical protein